MAATANPRAVERGPPEAVPVRARPSHAAHLPPTSNVTLPAKADRDGHQGNVNKQPMGTERTPEANGHTEPSVSLPVMVAEDISTVATTAATAEIGDFWI